MTRIVELTQQPRALAEAERTWWVAVLRGLAGEVFHVRAGHGPRQVELSDSLAAYCEHPRVEFVTVKGDTNMTQENALHVEGALTWALSGEGLREQRVRRPVASVGESTLQAVAAAGAVDLEGCGNVLVAWAQGVRGPQSLREALAEERPKAWKRAKDFWMLRPSKVAALDGALAAGQPVAVVSIGFSRDAPYNVVLEAFQVAGWEESGTAYSLSPVAAGEERAEVTALRERLRGKQLRLAGRPLMRPTDFWSDEDLAQMGGIRNPVWFGPLFD